MKPKKKESQDYLTKGVDEAIAAIDGWPCDSEPRHHAKLLAHEVRKLRVGLGEERRAIAAAIGTFYRADDRQGLAVFLERLARGERQTRRRWLLLLRVRAKGGHLVHLVAEGCSRVALCGVHPGSWVDPIEGNRDCAHCAEISKDAPYAR